MFVTTPMTVYTHSEPYDFYRYTEYGLRYLLEKHGFEVVTVRRLGGVVSVMASHGINLGCEALSERVDRSALRKLRRLLLLPLSAGGSLAMYWLSKLCGRRRAARRDRLGGDVPAAAELTPAAEWSGPFTEAEGTAGPRLGRTSTAQHTCLRRLARPTAS